MGGATARSPARARRHTEESAGAEAPLWGRARRSGRGAARGPTAREGASPRPLACPLVGQRFEGTPGKAARGRRYLCCWAGSIWSCRYGTAQKKRGPRRGPNAISRAWLKTAGPPPRRGGRAEGRTKARKSGGPHDGGGRRPAGGGRKGTGEKQTRGTPPKQATGAGGRHRRTPMAAGERQGAAPSPARGRGLAQALAPPAIMGEAGGGRGYPPRPFRQGRGGRAGVRGPARGPRAPARSERSERRPFRFAAVSGVAAAFPLWALAPGAPPFPAGKGAGGDWEKKAGPRSGPVLPPNPARPGGPAPIAADDRRAPRPDDQTAPRRAKGRGHYGRKRAGGEAARAQRAPPSRSEAAPEASEASEARRSEARRSPSPRSGRGPHERR